MVLGAEETGRKLRAPRPYPTPVAKPCLCSGNHREDHRGTMNTEKNKGQHPLREVTIQ